MSSKKIHRNGLIGQMGVNLIERIVLEMGCVWNQSGILEAGIDGNIELRDDQTGVAFNYIVQVQSKATRGTFQAETESDFEFRCEERDLDYWIGGNAPVILVVSRPATLEAYWVSVKDYFRDPQVRSQRIVRFNKVRDRFTTQSRDALFQLAAPENTGLYLSAPPREETLWSNLLRVDSFASHIYGADTKYDTPGDLMAVFRERDLFPGREWFIKSGRLISFRDLTESPWCDVCDRGTVEEFTAHEWADSSDVDLRRDFARLLNRSLEEKIAAGVRYDREKRCYHFKAIGDRQLRTLEYRNLRSSARRTVVKAYPSKRDASQIAHWRHAAFKGMFKRLDGKWYLEITPTYHFTSDGRQIHPFYGDLLTGIKRLEHNQNVLSQVLMWAAVLTQPPDMFTPSYPFLTFGQLEQFTVDAGIDDEQWLPQEDEAMTANAASWLYDAPLFALEAK